MCEHASAGQSWKNKLNSCRGDYVDEMCRWHLCQAAKSFTLHTEWSWPKHWLSGIRLEFIHRVTHLLGLLIQGFYNIFYASWCVYFICTDAVYVLRLQVHFMFYLFLLNLFNVVHIILANTDYNISQKQLLLQLKQQWGNQQFNIYVYNIQYSARR